MVEREVGTLERLSAAAARGIDPERARARLHALRALVDGEVERLEERLPDLCADAPSDMAAAARHLLGAGGKRVRPLLVLLAARAADGGGAAGAGRDGGAAAAFAAAAELVHNATLLHDDVIDEGQMRRGRPAARVVWGNMVSVLGGDFLLARALELVDQAGVPGALTGLLAVIRRMVDGEALQLHRRGRLDPDEDAYRAVVDAKTASLFAWCGRAGALAATQIKGTPDKTEALEAYGFHLGRAFQIVDDCLDLSDDTALGKDVLADVREGKLTLPILYALRRDPSLARTLDAAAADPDPDPDPDPAPPNPAPPNPAPPNPDPRRSPTPARDLAARIARAARRSGALDAARADARAETVTACAALDRLPPGPYRDALAGIARELAERGC